MLLSEIQRVCERSKSTYVSLRITEELKANQTVIASWRMAVKKRRYEKGRIFHSDCGVVQYACHAFVNILKSYHVTPSMSRKGNY